MSSILRALKKLESDPRHLEETPLLDSKFVPLADRGPQKTPAGLIMMVFGGGIVCGLVILAGWWLFSEKTGSSSIGPPEVSQQGLQQSEIIPVRPRNAEIPERPAPALAPAKPAADIGAPPKTAAQVPEASPVEMPQLSSPAIKHREVIKPVAEPAPESAAPKPSAPGPETNEQIAAQEVAVAVTKAPEAALIKKEIEIPALNDPGMKLQAITWSKDRQKRIVVINNRILRQGETVSGYRIDTINQDDVIINDAGEKWKLVFRIK